MTEKVTIKGTTYNVEKRTDLEAIKTERPNTHRAMERNGWAAELILKRPRGAAYYMALEHTNGTYTAPFKVA